LLFFLIIVIKQRCICCLTDIHVLVAAVFMLATLLPHRFPGVSFPNLTWSNSVTMWAV